MPTVLLVDVSLSMAKCSPVTLSLSTAGSASTSTTSTTTTSTDSPSSGDTLGTDSNKGQPECSKKALSVRGVYTFLDQLTKQSKLEYVSLVVFSSLYEVLVPFTRDFDQIKAAADELVLYDKSCLDNGLSAARDLLQSTWAGIPSKIVLFTDGLLDLSASSYQKLCNVNLPSSCQLYTVCVSSPTELCCPESIEKLKKVFTDLDSECHMPDTPTFQSIDELVAEIVDEAYLSYSGSLACGHMKCHIQLYPAPTSQLWEEDFNYEHLDFPHSLSVIGFLSMSDIKSPACISRHLVLPLRDHSTEPDDGKSPAFTVMLHGALKLESAVALVVIRESKWYGMLHSWADSRKKSNLVLSIFQPGLQAVPWLGDLSMLGVPLDTASFPGLDLPPNSGLPVPVTDKKSYSSMPSSWLRQASLQSDIQKLLRYGKKLPDKLNIFYKELNRVHKAAVSSGFLTLLTGLSNILEREVTMLPPTAHPDASIQLQHAASLLRHKDAHYMDYIIQPLDTNYSDNI